MKKSKVCIVCIQHGFNLKQKTNKIKMDWITEYVIAALIFVVGQYITHKILDFDESKRTNHRINELLVIQNENLKAFEKEREEFEKRLKDLKESN